MRVRLRARRSVLALMIATASVGALVPTTTVAGGSATTSAVTWGSLRKGAPGMSGAPLVDIRAGRHACFDRLVFDIDGAVRGYNVRYRTQVTHIASGEPIPLRGGAALEVVVRVPDTDEHGNVTFPRAGRRNVVAVTGFQTFRQVAWAGSQEGVTAVGLGVRARLPFRVFVLPGPGAGSRLVVDVAHHW